MKLGGKADKPKKLASRSSLNNYYSGASKPVASPFEKKKPTRNWQTKLAKLADISIIVVVVLLLLYSLIIKPDPKVIVSSNVYHAESVYSRAAASTMSGLKDRTKLTFDETTTVTSLQSQFPEIASASVELPVFGQTPVVRLNIAAPQFIYTNQRQVFVLASDGVIIRMNKLDPKLETLTSVVDQSGFKAQEGKAVLSSEQVSFINQVVIQLQTANVPIKWFTLPAAAQEADLYTKDKPYYVKFYLGGDPLVQVGQFLAARHQFAANHQNPSKYLDVRVAGKIFYK